MKLAAVDLNLLPVLDALLETENVTHAARQVGLSQPAVSNALRRLRALLDDPVLVRHGRHMVATATARQLRPVLRQALNAAALTLSKRGAFDLKQTRDHIRVAFSDYWHFALLPRLMEVTARDAPGLTVEVCPLSERVLEEGLPKGEVDVAIYLGPVRRPGLSSIELVRDSYSCVVRRRHPLLSAPRGLESFARFRHVMVSPVGPWAEAIEAAFAGPGFVLERALQTAHIPIALAVVARTNHITVIPSRIARQAAQQIPVKVMPLPVPTGQFALHLYWHDRTEHDPLRAWVRHTITTLAREGYSRPTVF